MSDSRIHAIRYQAWLALGVAVAASVIWFAWNAVPRAQLAAMGIGAGIVVVLLLRYPIIGAVLAAFAVFSAMGAFVPKSTFVLLTTTALMVLCNKLMIGDFTWRIAPIGRWGLLLCAWSLISFTWASRYDYFFVGHLVRVALIILVFSEVFRTPRDLVWVLFGAVAGIGVTGAFTVKTAIAFFTTGTVAELSGMVSNIGGSRFGGHWAEFNMMALAVVPVIGVSLAMIRTAVLHMGLRLLLVAGAILGVAAVVLSLSRGGIICLVTCLLIVISADRRRWTIGLASVLVLSAIVLLLPVDLFGRIGTMFEARSDASISQRSKLIEAGIQMFKDHLLVGVGYGNFRSFSSDLIWPQPAGMIAHNSYVETMAETGLIGTFLHLGVLGAAFAAVRVRDRRLEARNLNRNLAIGMGGSLAAVVLGMGTLSATFYAPFWIVLVLISIRESVFAESPDERLSGQAV